MPDPIRWSYLREMRRSPAHYRYALTAPRTETPAMRLGTVVHALVFGQEAPPIWDGTRRGKDWELFKADNPGTIITADEAQLAGNIAAAVVANDQARRVLDGLHEQRIDWTVAGRDCTGRVDVLGANWISDLKVTADASPERFPFHARRMGYHAQLAWYRNGAMRGDECDLYLVAVEAKPPHPVTVFHLSPSACDMGERTWRGCFERLLVCEASDNWPGYVECIQELDALEDFNLTIDGEEVNL